MRRRLNTASLTAENGQLVYTSSYDKLLVAALKTAIPSTDRCWDNQRKAWLVTPTHAQTLVDLTAQYLGVDVKAPAIGTHAAQSETRMFDVRYVGVTKERTPGEERSAFGYSENSWRVLFPESVLRNWFGAGMAVPGESVQNETLYAVLGIKQRADESEIRSAYRRMARQWHPDVCHEPNATERFIRIQQAYEMLRDAKTRARYDAGLLLETSAWQNRDSGHDRLARLQRALDGYRPPLRCGLLLVEGTEQLGRFVVSEILAWEDIVRADGLTLVTSWQSGAKTFVEEWI